MENLSRNFFYNKKFTILGHRGVPYLCKENTLESFKMAIDLNYDGIELDIMGTKDNKIIVRHDLKELKRNVLELNHKPALTNYPLLEDILIKIGHQTKINVEIKNQGNQSLTVLKKTMKLIKKFNLIDNIIISSFNPKIIKQCKKKDDRFATAWIWGEKTPYFYNIWNFFLKQHRADAIHVHYKLITEKTVKKFHSKNLKILAYTINEKNILNDMISKNVDGIFTDNPAILKEAKRLTL